MRLWSHGLAKSRNLLSSLSRESASPIARGPWRSLYALSVAALVISYAIVALYAMWLGPSDFTVPLKISFAIMIGILTLESVDNVRSSIKVNMDRALPSFQSLLILIVSLFLLASAAASFFVSARAQSLMSLDITIKFFASIGLSGPLYYSVIIVQDVWKAYSKREGER